MEDVLTEYELGERIHSGRRSLVYRARRRRDGAPVVIKTQEDDRPSLDDLARFRREHQIGRSLSITGVVPVQALLPYKSRLALVMEDVGAVDLRTFRARHRLALDEILELGIRLAATLGEVHARRVIHKDVNPSNIVIHPETRTAHLIDFGIATTLSRESPSVLDPNVIEGTLAYISPEQTGRMNRSIDYRTDFYSLGATLYELITGALPFSSDDPMELVHCHIAREPAPPHALRADLPRAISDVVMKLLAKTAEERYQSAHGIVADLSECLAQIRASGRVEGFVPGRRDVSGRFQIPQKLYGREEEIEVLLGMLDRVSRSRAELLLVAGQPGIGKSALVNEVHKPLVHKRGYFISGKFDQLKRDIPYASVIEAFQDLIRQILAESEARLAGWRTRLGAALGHNAPVIAEVLPAIELILGKQPALEPLPPVESQNRFNLVFENFVRAFAAEDHPLVVFLDDLQWADAPSLKLLQLLLTSPDMGHLCVLGAYRDNEVPAGHPLLAMLGAVREAGTPVTDITLGPLGERNVAAIVQETVRCERGRAEPLAALLFQKTAGNPFFVGQVLGALHDDGLIAHDAARGEWRWDLDAIRGRGLTDNVVELMVGRLQKLPAEAQQALRLAACIGNRFDLGMLATVSRLHPAETARHAWPAVEEGLLLPVGDAHRAAAPSRFADGDAEPTRATFRFLHDRVQQAAYSLIAEERRPDIHLDIARLLLSGAAPEAIEDGLFDIVNQLELGLPRIDDEVERYEVARLALRAGKKAKASAAWEPALRYLDIGLRMLPPEAFEEQHDLAFEMHVEATVAAYLNTDFERAEALSNVAMDHAGTVLERVTVLETRILFHAARGRLDDTVSTGLSALEMLGIHIPRAPVPEDFPAGLAKIQQALAGRRIEDLADLPPMRDPGMLAAMRIIYAISALAMATNPLQWLVLMCEYLHLCVAHGNSRFAPVAYGGMCAVQAGALQDIETARAYGKLALLLQDRIGARECASSTIGMVNLFCTPWTAHIREMIAGEEEATRVGLEAGDIQHAGYGILTGSEAWLMSGEPLPSVIDQLGRHLGWLTRYKQDFARGYVSLFHQTALTLAGRSADPLRIVGESYDEEKLLPEILATKNIAQAYMLYICRAMVSYLLGDLARAAEAAEAAEPFGQALRGHPIAALLALYQALTLLTFCEGASEADREKHLAKVDRNLAELRMWSKLAPQNYQHKADLVEAERARFTGDVAKAIDGYERAIAGAAQHGYLQDEALAGERCAELCLSRGWDRMGEAYLADAHYGYVRWGADAKVQELERRHPWLSSSSRAGRRGGDDRSPLSIRESTSHRQGGSVLDLTALMRASRAISGEIVLDRLIQALMRIMVEIAGAQRGFFLLDKEGALVIEAEWAAGRDEVIARRSAPLDSEPNLAQAIVSYAARTGESVVLGDASAEGLFVRDAYVTSRRPKSVLCGPLVNQGKLIAVVYLENNLASNAFTTDRLEALRLLSAQAALSIHNATLYATLEAKVEARTQELSESNQDLARALGELRATQQQLVTQEKLASLGALTAGIAHELKNPLNFINNFAEGAAELSTQISEMLHEQRGRLDPEALAELDDMLESLGQGVRKIDEHGKKANGIIGGMLLHARHVPGEREVADLNAMLVQTADLVDRGMRARIPDALVRREDVLDPSLGPVEVVAQDLRRVFVNILDNAVFAMLDRRRTAGPGFVPQLTLRTLRRGDRVEVRIRDNGVGIPSEIASRIFDPFFTTKPPGQGTGLGLSLSHEIVVRGHGGEIRMETVPGDHTEFIISLPARAG